MRRLRLLALAAAVSALAGCAADDEELLAPVVPTTGGELFQRYVAIGNSITAGMQSFGLTDSLQAAAYPSLIAAQAGAAFVTPGFNDPGCPSPLAQPFLLGSGTIGGPNAPPCALRSSPQPRIVQNLAVPGAEMADALNALNNPNPGDFFNRLQTFVLGGRSMVRAMIQADPSLVTVALGSGDALGAVNGGDPGDLTPVADFRASVERIAAAIADSTDAEDAVFIGAFNGMYAPYVQPGAYFFALRQAGALPIPVNANCAPGTPGSRNLVSFDPLVFDRATTTEINCADDAPSVLSLAEQAAVAARVAAYNQAIREVAEARGFLFVDINPLFAAQLANPNAIRKCQGFLGLTPTSTPAEFQQAVVATCPGPTAPNFFGALFSFDAQHPSSLAHRIIANQVIAALNAEHGLSIPALSIPAF